MSDFLDKSIYLPAKLQRREWACPKCRHTWIDGVARCFVCSTARPDTVEAMKDTKVIENMPVMGGMLPSSVSYLHALAANGQGDLYDWDKGRVEVEICGADRTREKTLEQVERVELIYK